MNKILKTFGKLSGWGGIILGVEKAKKIMMDHFANTARRFGLSELYGYIYGVLFFEDEPLSLGEIAERTGYSLSHVSTA